MRKMFDKPTRLSTTVRMFPNKMSVAEFVAYIRDCLEPFEKNLLMDNFPKEQFIEEWFETMGAWMEIETE